MASVPKFSITKHKLGYYCIYIPGKYSEKGTPERKYYKTKKEAKEAQGALIEASRASYNYRVLSPEEIGTVKLLEQRLAPHGVSIEQAVNEWIANKNQTKSKTVQFVVTAYLEQFTGRSKKYEGAVRRNCELLIKKFGDTETDHLMPRDFEIWLEVLTKTPYSFAHALKGLKAVFAWAKKMRYATINPIEHVSIKPLPHIVPHILSVDQAKSLITACRDLRQHNLPDYISCDATDALTAVCILLFAGIRPAELSRLTWDDIFLDKQLIRVPATSSKTRTLRLVHIESNLLSLLQSIPHEAKKTGKIIPKNWERKWKAIRKIANISNMQDICRHSYASYWLASNQDMNGLLANMGHTTSQVTLKHYLTAASREEGKAYFGISPTYKIPTKKPDQSRA